MILSFSACLDCGCVLRSNFFGFFWILDRFGTPIWTHFGIKVMKKWGLKKWWKKCAEKGLRWICRGGCGSLKRRHSDCSAADRGGPDTPWVPKGTVADVWGTSPLWGIWQKCNKIVYFSRVFLRMGSWSRFWIDFFIDFGLILEGLGAPKVAKQLCKATFSAMVF